MNLPVATVDPREPAFVRDPYPTYAALRARGPAVQWPALGFPVLTRHAEVNALLRDRRFGRQILHKVPREALGWPAPAPHLAAFDAFERHRALELEPPAHMRIRALVHPPFVPRRIAALEASIAALAHELVDGFIDRGRCELLDDFARHLPVLVIAGFLGVPRAMAPQLLAWSHDMVAIYQVRRDRAIEDRAEAATRAFTAWMREELAARRAAPGDDVLSQLIAARTPQGESLSTDELVTTAILLLNAGHEATVNGFGNGMGSWLPSPAYRRYAVSGPSVGPSGSLSASPSESPSEGGGDLGLDIALLVEEMLRHDSPSQLFERTATQDTVIALAFILNFNRVAVLLGVYSNLPWILVPYYAFTTMAGAAILRTETPTDLRERLTAIFALSVRNAEFWHELVRLIRPLFWPYMLGSLIGATVLSFVAYRVALEFVVRRRRHHALHHPPKPPSQP